MEIKINHCAIFLTERCNLACGYCYQRNLPNKRDLNIKTGEEIIDFLFSNVGEYLSIAFFGGEPLLKFDLLKHLVEYGKEKAKLYSLKENKKKFRISFSINTNGTIIDREKIEYLRKNRIGMVLSLDGTPEAHDLRRRDSSGKGCFHLLKKNIPLLMEDPRQVHIRMTVSPETVDKMYEGARFIHFLGFRSLAVAMDRSSDLWDENKREIFRNQYKEIVDWYMEKLREGSRFSMVDLDFGAISLDFPYREKGMPCNAGMEGIAIDPDSVIFPCYRFVGFKGTEIGNIYDGFDDTKRDLYCSYSRLELEKCKSCKLNYRCHRCPWLSYIQTGDISKPVEINCFEAELMIGMFKYLRETMEKEENREFLKRMRMLGKRYFSGKEKRD